MGQVEEDADRAAAFASLSPSERAWAEHSEALWRRAHAIASAQPGLDAGDVYHALRCLELSPSQRLKQALDRGHPRTSAR